MDEPVWTKSICNELGRLSQIWKKHASTDIIRFSFNKDKPKDRRATYVRAVCKIIPQKIETPRTRLTSGGNNKNYQGEFSTPTSDLTSIKLQVNSAILDIKSLYTCMDMKYFYLNSQMYISEYIMI